jgi:hypothetical protein
MSDGTSLRTFLRSLNSIVIHSAYTCGRAHANKTGEKPNKAKTRWMTRARDGCCTRVQHMRPGHEIFQLRKQRCVFAKSIARTREERNRNLFPSTGEFPCFLPPRYPALTLPPIAREPLTPKLQYYRINLQRSSYHKLSYARQQKCEIPSAQT